jgi:hypothetical protein
MAEANDHPVVDQAKSVRSVFMVPELIMVIGDKTSPKTALEFSLTNKDISSVYHVRAKWRRRIETFQELTLTHTTQFGECNGRLYDAAEFERWHAATLAQADDEAKWAVGQLVCKRIIIPKGFNNMMWFWDMFANLGDTFIQRARVEATELIMHVSTHVNWLTHGLEGTPAFEMSWHRHFMLLFPNVTRVIFTVTAEDQQGPPILNYPYAGWRGVQHSWAERFPGRTLWANVTYVEYPSADGLYSMPGSLMMFPDLRCVGLASITCDDVGGGQSFGHVDGRGYLNFMMDMVHVYRALYNDTDQDRDDTVREVQLTPADFDLVVAFGVAPAYREPVRNDGVNVYEEGRESVTWNSFEFTCTIYRPEVDEPETLELTIRRMPETNWMGWEYPWSDDDGGGGGGAAAAADDPD